MPTSSPAFDAPLRIEARPSRALPAVVAAAYGLAGAGLAFVPLPWMVAGLAVLGAGLARDVPRLRRGVRLRWEADGTWTDPAAGDGGTMRLAAATFVSRWLVVLNLVGETGERRRVALARDALPGATWRRLVARLRVTGPRTAAGSGGWQASGADP